MQVTHSPVHRLFIGCSENNSAALSTYQLNVPHCSNELLVELPTLPPPHQPLVHMIHQHDTTGLYRLLHLYVQYVVGCVCCSVAAGWADCASAQC